MTSREKLLYYESVIAIHKLSRLKANHFPGILAIFIFIILTLGIPLWWLAVKEGEGLLIKEARSGNLTLTIANANILSDFFQEFKVNLVLLAEAQAIKSGNTEEGSNILKLFIKEHKGNAQGDMVRVNKDGQVIFGVNATGQQIIGTGISLIDRDYFQWASQQPGIGEVFIAKSVVARDDTDTNKPLIIMASPVFSQDQFEGLVFISFDIDALVGKYVTPLAKYPDSSSMIVDNEGNIVATSIPAMMTKNINSPNNHNLVLDKENFQRAIQMAKNNQEGSFILDSLIYNKPQTMIISIAPIKMGEQIWSLWLSVPQEKVLLENISFKLRSIYFLVYVLVSFVVLMFIFILGVRLAQRDGFFDGYMDGHNIHKQPKNN